MALHKAMILVGALLLVPTFQKRIKLDQEYELALGKTEEMIKHANDRAMNKAMRRTHVTSPDSVMSSTAALKKAMKQKAKHDQGELAEAEAAVKRKQAQVPLEVIAQKNKGPASIPTSPSPDAMETTNGSNTSKETKEEKEDKQIRAKGKDKDRAKDKGEETGKDKGEEEGKSNGRMAYRDAVGSLGIARQRARETLFSSYAYQRGDFVGFIYEETPATKTLHIKSSRVFREFRREAVIPLGSNSVGAKVGDSITFDLELVQQGNGKPQPVAVNVFIRSSYGTMIAYKNASGLSAITPLTFLRAGFFGLIYQEMPATKTLLIACWKARDEFGTEAVIPLWSNPVGAKVGDNISFDVEHLVQEGEGKPRPMAMNVQILSRGDGKVVPKVQAPTDVCTQVLYYLSDENLRTDTFFQDTIATTEGGWISTDILLGCRRMQQLAASPMTIIKCFQNAPGVEVRDTLGQEAVRRTSPPPQLEGLVAVANVAKQSAAAPALAKKIYTKETLTLLGELALKEEPGGRRRCQRQRGPWQPGQSTPAALGPEAEKHEWGQWQGGQSTPVVAGAEGPEVAILG